MEAVASLLDLASRVVSDVSHLCAENLFITGNSFADSRDQPMDPDFDYWRSRDSHSRGVL